MQVISKWKASTPTCGSARTSEETLPAQPHKEGTIHRHSWGIEREKGKKGKQRNEGTQRQGTVGLCQSGHTGENICCVWGCIAANQSTLERRIADGCALANVALGNLGYWYSIWSLFYHPQLCILCSCQGVVFPDDNGFFWQVKALCHTAKNVHEWFDDMRKKKCWLENWALVKCAGKIRSEKVRCMFYLRTYRN